MEFLRFGSSIPGSYWGCCAMDIIQNFKVDPDAPAAIQLVGGDGGNPILDNKSSNLFAGPTYKDIFLQRIRFGTFDKRDMPNHGFLAILTQSQIDGVIGKKWLAILRETGFEFIRTVVNSVYTGSVVLDDASKLGTGSSKNYLFGLFRNIGSGGCNDPFTPPKGWTDLPSVKAEAWEFAFSGTDSAGASADRDYTLGDTKSLAAKQFAEDKAIWDRIGEPKLLTEAEAEAAGAVIHYAGRRSEFPQQPKTVREQLKAAKAVKTAPAASAFPVFPETKGCGAAVPTATL